MGDKPRFPYTISPLAEAAEAIPALARWQHAEWAALNPGDTEENRALRLAKQVEASDLPQTWVARALESILGSASLVPNDMDTHPEWEPWLASVFVAPEHRGKGVGKALIRRVEEEAKSRGFASMYLFTTDRASFYEALQWEKVAEETYRGERVTVMRRRLA